MGQMLGHKVDFENISHAKKTIIQLRKHGIQQQMIAQKQEIQKIATALDQQLYQQRKNGMKPRSSNRSPYMNTMISPTSKSTNFQSNEFSRKFFNQTIDHESIKTRNKKQNYEMPDLYNTT